MAPLCYRRHRFPPEIIQHAIWLYLLFTLSYRDVPSGRSGDVESCEFVRRVHRFQGSAQGRCQLWMPPAFGLSQDRCCRGRLQWRGPFAGAGIVNLRDGPKKVDSTELSWQRLLAR